MMKVLVFFLFFLITKTDAAPIPTKFRYEFHLGKSFSNYKEIRNSVLVPDRDFDQDSYFGEFQTTYWAIPKYLDFKFGARQIGFGATTTGTDAELYTFENYWLNSGIHFPILSDFLWFKIVGEMFYGNMRSEDDFGFVNLNGFTVYPGVEFFPRGTDMFFSVSPYIRVPIISGNNVWRESTFGLNLKFPVVRGQPKFPVYAYQKAFIIRIIYSKIEVAIRKSGYLPVDAEHSWTGLSLGFEW